jgi:hypothetical protein
LINLKNSLNEEPIPKEDNEHQKVIACYRYCYPDLYIDNYRHRNNHFRFFQHKTGVSDSIISVIIPHITYDQL